MSSDGESGSIVVCGEALVDLIPTRIGDEVGYLPRPGGSPFNVAVALARLEVPTAFLGRVSTDVFGDRLTDHLSANGVDLRYVRRATEPTTLAVVHVEEGREPSYSFYREGTADRALSPDDVPPAFPEDVRAIHVGLGSITLEVEPAASTLRSVMEREHGARIVSFDPNVRAQLIDDPDTYGALLAGWVPLVDLAKVSRADLGWLFPGDDPEVIASRWLDLGVGLVVVSLGPDGALGVWRGGSARVPGVRVEVADTVGAGDAFTAGLLASLGARDLLDRERLERLSPADATEVLTYASRVAAITCTRVGADPPWRREVEGPEAVG